MDFHPRDWEDVEASLGIVYLCRVANEWVQFLEPWVAGWVVRSFFRFSIRGAMGIGSERGFRTDLYPTYLQVSKGLSAHQATVATIIGTCTSFPFRLNSPLRLKSIQTSTRPLLHSYSSVGAICGGTSAGFTSQYLGRRLTIIIYIVSVGAFIPLWILPNSFPKLAAGAFCVQFFVQGAWGVIPIQLAELSPADFRATVSETLFLGLSLLLELNEILNYYFQVPWVDVPVG